MKVFAKCLRTRLHRILRKLLSSWSKFYYSRQNQRTLCYITLADFEESVRRSGYTKSCHSRQKNTSFYIHFTLIFGQKLTAIGHKACKDIFYNRLTGKMQFLKCLLRVQAYSLDLGLAKTPKYLFQCYQKDRYSTSKIFHVIVKTNKYCWNK